jgi:hypothetical protein
MIQAAEAEFTQSITIVSRDVRFVCFICDAGAAVNSTVVRDEFTNPCRIDDIVTLPPFENLEWGIWLVSPSDSSRSCAVKRTLSGRCANSGTFKAIPGAIIGRILFRSFSFA